MSEQWKAFRFEKCNGKAGNIGQKKVVLMLFMFVAGDHAKNDMAGEEDSWKSELEEKGYEVRVILKGLENLKESENIRRTYRRSGNVRTS